MSITGCNIFWKSTLVGLFKKKCFLECNCIFSLLCIRNRYNNIIFLCSLHTIVIDGAFFLLHILNHFIVYALFILAQIRILYLIIYYYYQYTIYHNNRIGNMKYYVCCSLFQPGSLGWVSTIYKFYNR